MDIADLAGFKHTPVDGGYPEFIRTFYSPVDDVHGVLKSIIASATQSIVLEMYGYADDELAGLIAKALDDPEMYVQVSLDRSQAGGVHERELLASFRAEMDSNSVAVGTSRHAGAIAHRKMLVVDGVWRISGSTNWSISGETAQENELTVIHNAVIAAEARFAMDKTHSAMLTQMQRRRDAEVVAAAKTARV